jgi:programmed cell death 6-interacting protein
LAHGGSGDVKTEWFEGLFEESLRRYDEVKGDMDREVERQEGLLSQIRVSHPSRAI